MHLQPLNILTMSQLVHSVNQRLQTSVYSVRQENFDVWFVISSRIYEPPHDKTKKNDCAPSEDLDQPWHPPSLINLRYALNG